MVDEHDEKAVWIGCGVAVGATLVLATLAAAFESTINSPGSRTIAPPVLWAFGGGLGLCIGAFLTSWLTRRFWPGALAALVGAIPFLVLVILGYNDDDLRLGDQVVGSLVIVVLPGFVAALVFAVVGTFTSRMLGARQPRNSLTT